MKTCRILTLTGYSGVGKSTVARYLYNKYDTVLLNHIKEPMMEMALPLLRNLCPNASMKELLAKLDGTFEQKNAPISKEYPHITGVSILKALGTDFRDAIDPLLWVNLRIKKARERLGNKCAINESCRFQNELAVYQSHGGYSINILRKGYNGIGIQGDTDKYEPLVLTDFTVNNDASLPDLFQKIDSIATELGLTPRDMQ